MANDTFEKLFLKDMYRHNRDNLIEDFYIPVLKRSRRFYRAAGYFSSSIFDETILGIPDFIQNGGVLKIVTSYNLTEKDVALLGGLDIYKRQEYISKSILEIITDSCSKNQSKSAEIFCWLISNGYLEIKIAFGDSKDNFLRLFHEKIGLFEFVNGECIGFKGSANESKSAFTLNFESIDVFKKEVEIDRKRYDQIEQDFWDLWENTTNGLSVFEIDEPTIKIIKEIAEKTRINNGNIQNILRMCNEQLIVKGFVKSSPKLKKSITIPDWFEVGIYEHQKLAFRKWRENSYNGFFQYATGSGKTLTALYCAAKLFNKEKKLFILISVPQIFIAEQWNKELEKFGVKAIRCYQGKSNWSKKLMDAIQAYNIGSKELIAVVVVNATMVSDLFQRIIQGIQVNMLFIGDEAHNLGASTNFHKLPKQKAFSIGLSATPIRFMDEEGTNQMLSFFGGVVAEFGLKEALELNVLTPYYYHVIPIHLTSDEEQKFIELTDEIKKMSAFLQNKEKQSKYDEKLKKLRILRGRLLSNSKNKISAFQEEIKKRKPGSKTLIYCGSGNSLEEERMVDTIVHLFSGHTDARISKFTSCESLEQREAIIKMLHDGDIEAIAAIKCLDEGVDLPVVETAYFLSSGVNEKEFIQRRGRVLRKSPGKLSSHLFDFVVIPRLDSMGIDASKAMFKREFARIKEFASLAINKNQALEEVRYFDEILNTGESL